MKSKNKLSTEGLSKSLLTGSIIAIIIGFSPYIFYIYEIFPNGPVWETSFFTYESLYYEDVLTAAWTYLGKILPLFLLLIWFFTCKHWWYHAILVPIGMYFFQLITAVYQDVYMEAIFMDINGLIYLAPFFIAILSIVYLVRIKVFDKVYGIDLSEIERDQVSPFKNSLSSSEQRELDNFRSTVRDGQPEEDYYAKL